MTKRNIIVIGTSSGGVEALCELNKHLPKKLDASLFVAMHVGEESCLPEILNRCGPIKAISAEHNKAFHSGCIYVAPPRHHLLIKNGATILSRGPRENGYRPSIDVLFRSAARAHRSRVTGVILSGSRDDGVAGLYSIKSRGGVAVVQDPKEAMTPDMPLSALEMVEVDFCLPLNQIAEVLVQLAEGKVTSTIDGRLGGTEIESHARADHPMEEAAGEQIPLNCPECNGPLYEVKDGKLARFQCFVGHAFSPESLSDEHSDALERALWTAMRRLKERTVLHQKLVDRQRNKGEDALLKRLEESVATSSRDLKLLREILDRI